MQSEIQNIYSNIENLLVRLVPEKWESIYLYASVMERRRGEMYFYYFPKKILKVNPVNCYQVPDKFGIDEHSYNQSLEKLYRLIQSLNVIMVPKWTNITISIENGMFKIEYNYNEIEQSKYSDEERRIVWGYRHLHIPIEKMNLKEKALIETYNDEARIKPSVYTEKIVITKDGVSSENQEVNNQY